jgi:CRP/FNR family cyclic AMP-dependent transcriptional regulator
MNPAELFRHDADALQLAPGDFLFREGDKRDKMYVLLEGEMDIRLGDYVFETTGAGALIGVIALIDDSPRPANAVAKTACRLAPVDQRRFHFLVQQHPYFATHVMKELAARVRRLVIQNGPSAIQSAGRAVAKSSNKVATGIRTRRKV